MTDYRDGKIHGWNGGECPVHPKDKMFYWFRTGRAGRCLASELAWSHNNDGSYGYEIIAFQVTKKYREPRVVWVNVYANGSMGGVLYDTKDEAEKKVRGMLEVKQVKFVEVIEE